MKHLRNISKLANLSSAELWQGLQQQVSGESDFLYFGDIDFYEHETLAYHDWPDNPVKQFWVLSQGFGIAGGV